MARQPVIAVLGASGLIGHGVARDLIQRGFAVRALARRFSPMQKAALAEQAVETPLMSLSSVALAQLLDGADVVVNAVGVLQGRTTDLVHRDFVARLASVCVPQKLLLHFSVPGAAQDDPTDFSRSKHEAERLIAASGAPFVVLRPGFVIAANAYGGSALMRALAALPIRLPGPDSQAPFAAIALSDICETVARVAARWRGGEAHWRLSWDLVEETPGQVGDMVEIFRAHGGGPPPRLTLPGWLLTAGAWAGDAASALGWTPPVRSTAIREMRRGVAGDPAPWIAQSGIRPLRASAALAAIPATVQDNWFARLYLLKALAIAVLAMFWCASGLIALTAAFAPARAILLDHGFSRAMAQSVTIASSLVDIAVGCAIAGRRSCRAGLAAGIAVSLFYMAGAAILTPEIWLDPLGALVKTGPAIVLMLVCLALQDKR